MMANEPPTGPATPGLLPRRQSLCREHIDLFLISFAILFLELACIRWFASTIVFLTFFTNWVLLACVLGMSVGCLAADRPRPLIATTIPMTWVAVVSAIAILWAYHEFEQVAIDVGSQQAPQEVFFGTEYRLGDPSRFELPIEVIAGLFYVGIALMFVGPGQVLGRAFAVLPDRTAAYSTNLLGSLAGITAFAAVSWLHLPPVLWFAVGLGICVYFIEDWTLSRMLVQGGLAVLLLAAVAFHGDPRERTSWSPYYKVSYDPQAGSIATNNIIHQWLIDIDQHGPEYTLPHLLNRDAGGRAFEDVLIIGAGAGNDVQAALRHGARHVDAVEIDPVLYELGREAHPGRPYDDPRVTVHLDDGRNFLRRAGRQYDLVVYALVDSLVLHSGYSSLRLESFLFTEEAFRDVRARLKPGGVFAMYNYYRWGWVVGRLEALAAQVFGTRPIVLPLVPRQAIRPDDRQGGITLMMAGTSESAALNEIRSRFMRMGSFWANDSPRENQAVNAYGPGPPTAPRAVRQGWRRIAPVAVETTGIGPLPDDAWPFLYLRDPTIPALNLRGMALVWTLSLAILALFAPRRTLRLDGRMFFLGAGFMLLETRGVVQLALVFGATWVVNSIAFAAILVMALLGNLYVQACRPRSFWIYYIILLIFISIVYFFKCERFLGLSFTSQAILTCVVVFAPIAFAAVIFATAFRESRRPEVAFGSNIAGIVLGGLSEYGTLVFGLDGILIVAAAFYLLSALVAGRGRAGHAPA